jgi:hypothetical protein
MQKHGLLRGPWALGSIPCSVQVLAKKGNCFATCGGNGVDEEIERV